MGLPGKSRSSELKLVMRETHVSKSLLSAVCFFLKRDARLAAKKLVDTDTNMFSFFFYSEPVIREYAHDTRIRTAPTQLLDDNTRIRSCETPIKKRRGKVRRQ